MKYADVIANLSWHMGQQRTSADDGAELQHVTLSALQEFRNRLEYYTSNAVYTEQFISEVDSFVLALDEIIKQEQEAILDRCFMLIEALSVVMREATLANDSASDTEKKVLEYFEKNGNWRSTDNTLVADMYYRLLPKIYKLSDKLEGKDKRKSA